ncbi:hypothetical protein S40288_05130 [Stachybotrys chartarum IBT 40288]|nr:hypothetical protein S40288_05130 [Stachybotrys chartarum IBT 40288]
MAVSSSSLQTWPKLAVAFTSRKRRLAITVAAAFSFVFLIYCYMLASLEPHVAHASSVDWSTFAYTQYVTNSEYLCNSLMLFEVLHRLGSRPDRVLMYPSDMVDPTATYADDDDARLLLKARDEYGVHLVPITIRHRKGADPTWADSFTKLLAFNQTAYKRVLSLDSDSTILQPMDELFLLPPCPVAMPRAYWLSSDNPTLSSQVMLIQPSAIEFERIIERIDSAGSDDYDMEIANSLYKDSAMVLPHRPYDLLTGEFGSHDHTHYLGTDRAEWDPVSIYNEAKFLHFSDWPAPKPWLTMSDKLRAEKQPACEVRDGIEDCASRQIWNAIYDDFRERRERVCGRFLRNAR